jgi:hypothetical protein
VLVALVAMVVTLSWVRFRLSEPQGAAKAHAFDLRNPMLDARPGECVEMATADASQTWCVVVLENGLVRRPRSGPTSWGTHAALRTELPYLACEARVPAPDTGGCAGGKFVGNREVILYDLSGFGIPKGNTPRVDMIQGKWMEVSGRLKFVYQVVIERFGNEGGSWVTYVSEDLPVTGLVLTQASVAGGRPQTTFFRDAGDCPLR